MILIIFKKYSMKSSIELIRLVAVIMITFTHTRHSFESGITYFIIEKLPLYGTAILSVISGFLYYNVSRKKKKLFDKKVKTLAIPYLIANVVVLLPVLILNFIFDYNILNRLSYDSSLILEGIFSLNSPPINPPTYFIRDIFIIFSIIALITQKEFKTLIILIPFILFGTLILRFDVAALFIIGLIYGHFQNFFKKFYFIFFSFILSIVFAIWFPDFLKLPVSFLIFVIAIDINFKFCNTGRYSYLLHLYHTPIIIISYPIYSMFINNALLLVFAQIIIALIVVFIIFLLTKKYEILKILSGGR